MTDLTTAIGRLLSDASLRDEFRNDPVSVAEKIDLQPDHVAMFVGLDINQIESQATTLLSKRWNEVCLLYTSPSPRDRG